MRLAPVLRLAVAAALLCAVGCNSNNKGKIEGTKWSSMAATIKGQSFPAGTLKLTFGPDKQLAYDTPKGLFVGTYSLGWGDIVTLNLDRELAGSRSHAEKVTISGDFLTMSDSDGTSVTFERVKTLTGDSKPAGKKN
jgi:hypothetical protein